MTQEKKYDFLIVGAGLFGSVFAREVTDAGYSCLVIDKRNHIAGNCYTREEEGIQVHQYGAHIFHTNDEKVWTYVNRFTKFNKYRHMVEVNFRGKLLSFPINLKTLQQLYGVNNETNAVKHLESVREEITGKDFESWAKQQVGAELYEIFIKGYTEKQWGRPASELPSAIIKRIPIRTTANDDYFDDTYQGIPIGGYTSLVENMLSGIDVQLGVNYLDNKKEYDNMANSIVFTGPIDAYYGYQFGALAYRGLKFKQQTLETDSFQNTAVVNYTEAEIPFTRIIEHKKFDYQKSNKTIVTKEYPTEWCKGEEPFYPINDAANKTLYEKYRLLSNSEPNVIFGGRLAEYKYYDMHQVIASALTKSASTINFLK